MISVSLETNTPAIKWIFDYPNDGESLRIVLIATPENEIGNYFATSYR